METFLSALARVLTTHPELLAAWDYKPEGYVKLPPDPRGVLAAAIF